MPKAVQTELFPREPAKNFLDALKKRLGSSEFVRPATVADACNVSVNTVYGWMQEGTIEAVHHAGPNEDRGMWQVWAPSVIEYYRIRLENPS